MASGEILEIAKRFAREVQERIAINSLYIYGSHASGLSTAQSDIDIAVIVDSIQGDFLDMESLLYRIRRDIDDRIEPVLLEIGHDESGFLHSILTHGVQVA